MNNYRNNLPQLNGQMFLTDGGLETTLIFHQGLDLPHFACFPMLDDPFQSQQLNEYYEDYLKVAKNKKMGFILESPTFRSSIDWGYQLGYDCKSLHDINIKAIALLKHLKEQHEDQNTPIVISGCIGPRGDGYAISDKMTAKEANEYHQPQIQSFKEAGADLVTCFTINYIAEALGIVNAVKMIDMPVVVGFTVETDGHLPSGESLQEAIELVDQETGNYPAYYMINCAHPTHFADKLVGGKWIERIMAVRANASTKCHAELDECEHLDAGDKLELAQRYKELQQILPNLKVIGGCCGTDHTHVEEICNQLL